MSVGGRDGNAAIAAEMWLPRLERLERRESCLGQSQVHAFTDVVFAKAPKKDPKNVRNPQKRRHDSARSKGLLP
jgi:hypothetical protein